MFVSLLPFTTAFLSGFIHYKMAIGVYWLNILLLGMALLVHWNYAARHGHTSTPKADTVSVHQAIRNRIIVAQLLYAGGALLCFVNNYLSIAFIVSVQLNYAFAPFANMGRQKEAK